MHVTSEYRKGWLCGWAEETKRLVLGTGLSFRLEKNSGILLVIQLQKMEHH